MPLDEIGEGCIKLVLRVFVEILFEWVALSIWKCLQYLGAAFVWLVTFGRIWMLDEHENWAGVVGLLVIIALSVWLTRASLS